MKDPLLKDYKYLDTSSSTSSNSSTLSSNGTTASNRSTISTSESGQELWPVGVKLGIVRLGHAAGKLKYTLVDEQDIILAREYTFEARLEVDRHGTGAVVFAYAYLTNQNRRSSTLLLQDLIWRRHRGPIPERKRVVHRNHISMDNRLDNLCLIDIHNTHVWYTSINVVKSSNDTTTTTSSSSAASASKSSSNDLHLTLYWAAIQQLPPEHLQQNESSTTISAAAEATSATKCYDSDGNLIDDEDGGVSYFECHYAPCVRIERAPREFSICGRCQETRYCGTVCQQLDWPHHKRHCRTKTRRSAPYYHHQRSRWNADR